MVNPNPKRILHYFSIIPVLLANALIDRNIASALTLITINIIYMVTFAPVILDSGRKVAWKSNISPFIIALVIIPFLSSFHEIMMSVVSNIARPDLNVVMLAQQMGNKLFELLVVFSIVGMMMCRRGSCITISDERERFLTKRNGIMMISAIMLLALLIFSDNALSVFDGLILVLFYCVFLGLVYQTRRKGIEEIDESEFGSKKDINLKKELVKLAASVALVSLLARGTVSFSSYLIDSYAFFTKYSFVVIGMIAALPNLIISIVGIRKGTTSFVVALNIGSALWEMTISVAMIAFTSPLYSIHQSAITILAISMVVSAITVLVFIRTHFWSLKLWECLVLLCLYVASVVLIFVLA
jgi:Ca2+/Na+ antiporter